VGWGRAGGGCGTQQEGVAQVPQEGSVKVLVPASVGCVPGSAHPSMDMARRQAGRRCLNAMAVLGGAISQLCPEPWRGPCPTLSSPSCSGMPRPGGGLCPPANPVLSHPVTRCLPGLSRCASVPAVHQSRRRLPAAWQACCRPPRWFTSSLRPAGARAAAWYAGAVSLSHQGSARSALAAKKSRGYQMRLYSRIGGQASAGRGRREFQHRRCPPTGGAAVRVRQSLCGNAKA